MEKQPRKGPGRPRKDLAVPNAAEEGQESPDNDTGDGKARSVGSAVQAEPVRQNESWDQFHERIRHLAHKEPRLRNVWHPDPVHNLVMCANGNINVFQGDYKGQLNTGVFIEI